MNAPAQLIFFHLISNDAMTIDYSRIIHYNIIINMLHSFFFFFDHLIILNNRSFKFKMLTLIGERN